MKDLKRTNVTYNQVAGRYNITATEVQRIFDKHVNIEPHALPEALSIDEHYFPNSDYDGLYMFIMMDFRTGELIDIYPDRKKVIWYLNFQPSRIERITIKHIPVN